MLIASALSLAGLALLYFAGERLVTFSAALAEKLGVSPAVVGLTVVAAGTSAPELFVSLLATLQGRPEIALGNVIGSNIANLTLILGLVAALRAIPIEAQLARIEYPFMLVASALVFAFCRGGVFDRVEGAICVLAVAAFMGASVAFARRGPRDEKKEAASLVPEAADEMRAQPYWVLLGGLAVSIAGLGLGSRLLVDGAAQVAVGFGVPDRVIALTLVAIGTSLPEITASLLAAQRGHHGMAVANLVGSNIFNALAILGVSGLVRPLPISGRMLAVDFPAMLASALLLAPIVYGAKMIGRPAGVGLVAAYLVYTAAFVLR